MQMSAEIHSHADVSAGSALPPHKTVPEVAIALNVSERYVWALLKRKPEHGGLVSFTHGGRRYVLDSALAEYVARKIGAQA